MIKKILAEIVDLYSPKIAQDIQRGFNHYTANTRPRVSNYPEVQGWTMGWGYNDRMIDAVCLFPTDPDYMNGWNLYGKIDARAKA